MSVGMLFWILWIIGLLLGCGCLRDRSCWPVAGGGLLVWAMFFLLGLKMFGWPIHG